MRVGVAAALAESAMSELFLLAFELFYQLCTRGAIVIVNDR